MQDITIFSKVNFLKLLYYDLLVSTNISKLIINILWPIL